PRHDRQHEPRVRLHRRDLPDRRRDAEVPAADGAQRGAGRARRGVRQGAGPVARPVRRAGGLRVPGARPLHGRPVPGRAEAPAGPHLGGPRQADLAARRPGLRRERDGPTDEAVKESFPASDSPAVSHSGKEDEPREVDPNGSSRPHNPVTVTLEDGTTFELDHGHVALAAITSCTNTSNPYVMIGAALLAKKAVEKGLTRKPWVKTSLAPGSQVVTDYYERAGLTPYLDKIGFNLV